MSEFETVGKVNDFEGGGGQTRFRRWSYRGRFLTSGQIVSSPARKPMSAVGPRLGKPWKFPTKGTLQSRVTVAQGERAFGAAVAALSAFRRGGLLRRGGGGLRGCQQRNQGDPLVG